MDMVQSFILLLLGLFVLPFSSSQAGIDPIENLTIERMIVLDVHSTINPAVANYLQTEIARAKAQPSSLIILRLNTPGGLVTTTKDILAQFGSSERPIVVWVTPEGASATSAGAIITSGAHALYMNEGTNIGAATPVGLGEDIKEKDGRSKLVNDLSALVKSLAQARGHSADAYGDMISKASSFSAREAKAKGISDGVATSLEQLRLGMSDKVISLQGRKWLVKFAPVVEVVERPMDLGQRLLNVIADPSTAYYLFILGALLFYFEFQAPGGYVAGGVGALCLLLAGIAFQVMPLNYGAAGLLAVGLILLVLEIYVVSYGLLALAGVVCLGLGSLFLYRHENGWMTVPHALMFSSLAAVVAFGAFLAWYMARDRARQGGPRTFFTHASQEGQVIVELGQEGSEWSYQIKVAGEIWKARSAERFEAGQRVRIQRQSNESLILQISKLS